MSPVRAAILVAGIGLIFLWSIAAGWRGVDYGSHWDEYPNQIGPLKNSLARGVFLPGKYTYPGMGYWVCLGALAPELRSVVPEIIKNRRSSEAWTQASTALQEIVDQPAFLLRARRVYVVLCYLAIAWVAVAAFALRGDLWTAFLSAAILGGSWELGYHSRWVAPDAVMMSWATLCLACCLTAARSQHPQRWLIVAGIAGGLACGTKFPGGLLFALVLGAAVVIMAVPPFRLKPLVTTAVSVAAVFVVAYLLTTPGTVLEPQPFWQGVQFERDHYRMGHGGFSVTAGTGHLEKMLGYFAFDALSPNDRIGLALSGAAVFGWASLFWEGRWRWALLIVGFLATYVGFFSGQRAMIVRNYLIVLPFMAVLASHGIAVSTRLLREQWMKIGWGGLWCALLAMNLWWVSAAADTIGTPHKVYEDAFLRYVLGHPAATFLVSPSTVPFLVSNLPNVKQISADSVMGDWDLLAFMDDEWGDLKTRPSNLHDDFVAEFGPKDVNYRYYTTWLNTGRILVVTKEQAKNLRIPVLEASPTPSQD